MSGRLILRSAARVALAAMVPACGCVNPYVTVDTRLTSDPVLWRKLNGPRFAVVTDDPNVQTTLAFQEYAALWSRVAIQARPGLGDMSDPAAADLVFSLYFNIVDMGTGVATYPVYGWTRGYMIGCGRRVHTYTTHEVVGTEVRAYHRGFRHDLFVSAWVADPSQPAGRRVVWEGQAARTTDDADLKAAMPYLTVGLGRFYGQATSEPTRIKIDKDDLPSF
ncbi:MAG TPA: hypothetical protein VLM89_16670 [Phycisphaerae bacterium]|nr:hypothetical protein [Phycisphaerae bacterium]